MGWGSWEGGNKKKLVYLKTRWGEILEFFLFNSPCKINQFLIFSEFHGVGVTGGGQQQQQQ